MFAEISRIILSWFNYDDNVDDQKSDRMSHVLVFKKSSLNNKYSMSPSWIWSDKITNERVARVGYNHFISNKGEWNNCFS